MGSNRYASASMDPQESRKRIEIAAFTVPSYSRTVRQPHPLLAPESLAALVARGLSTREIAAELGFSSRYTQKRMREAGLKSHRRKGGRKPATHCYRGHPTPIGSRRGTQCSICRHKQVLARRAKKVAARSARRCDDRYEFDPCRRINDTQWIARILELRVQREIASPFEKDRIDKQLAWIARQRKAQ